MRTVDRLRLFLGRKPRLGRHVFLAPGAVVLGDATIGDHSSVWYNAVLRADINRIRIGSQTNIQDNAVIHVADAWECRLGDRVTIGHGALVHACVVEDDVLVGMGAIVLDGAVIGAGTILGAGALVPQGMKVPGGSLVLGRPGRVVRLLKPTERAETKRLARKYVRIAKAHMVSK